MERQGKRWSRTEREKRWKEKRQEVIERIKGKKRERARERKMEKKGKLE